MPTITPFLWFDDQAEAAADFYVSVFPDTRITHVQRNGEGGPGPAGSALVVGLELQGQQLSFLNGGPSQQLSEAFSLVVNCEGQDEVDRYWDALLADGGSPHACGWLKDRFGLSWQIVPGELLRLMADPDPAKAGAVVAAMLQMVKIDVAALQAAYDSV
jgi:predicted 3-demethylubiquinone-9 3-methyltransferase (glyoxalase superfamily)